MTPERQQVALAQACGWTDFEWVVTSGSTRYAIGVCPAHVRGGEKVRLPDYHDLNAIHAAEESILFRGDGLEAEGRRTRWGEEVDQMAVRIMQERGGSLAYLIPHLSAAQRTEVLLRTIEKWEGT